MHWSRTLSAALSVIVALSIGGCGHDRGATAPNIRYTVLTGGDQPLRDDFNRDRGDIKLMFLVDPICPGCLRGLADMGGQLPGAPGWPAPVL